MEYNSGKRHVGHGKWPVAARWFRPVIIGENREQLFMKCPHPNDIQRLVISRYFMSMLDRRVYLSKKYDLEFEDKVDNMRNGLIRSQYDEIRDKRTRNKIWGRDGTSDFDCDDDDEDIDNDDNDQGVDEITDSLIQDKKYNFKMLVYTGKNRESAFVFVSRFSPEQRAALRLELKRWFNRYRRDIISEPVLEVMSNYRMVTLTGKKRSTVVGFGLQSMPLIFLETLRYALKELKWNEILLCLMGFGASVGRYRRISPSALPVLWNYSFLTMVNHFKDDVSPVILLAKRLAKLFEGASRLYLGTHIAVWLIQKGRFMEAYDLLENDFAIENEKLEMRSFLRRQSYYSIENPKRDQAMFIFYLIKAVYLYTLWQKEVMTYNTCGDFFEPQYEDIVRRRGEMALGAFEYIYTLQKATGTDVMIFLEPFIELLTEYRSVGRARDVLLEMWVENEGNHFFELFLMDFLEKHAASAPGSWTEQLQKMREKIKMKFTCTVEKEATYSGRRKIKRLKARRKKLLSGPEFVEIDKPGFSLR